MSLAPSSSFDAPTSSAVEISVAGSQTGTQQSQTREPPPTLTFREHVEIDEFSDDDQADGSFLGRNLDIAPYAGHVTEDGLLLPVSLPGLRDLPAHYDAVKLEDTVSAMKSVALAAKDEPMEVEPQHSLMPGALSSDMFPKSSVAHAILASDSSLAFMQLPGLLAMMEKSDAPLMSNEDGEKETRLESSVAAAVAAADKMRGLGVDLRRVGNDDEARPIGRLKFFRSGRVQIVMQSGGSLDLEWGITPKTCQQLVLIDHERKTCEELQNTVTTRLVAVPSLAGL